MTKYSIEELMEELAYEWGDVYVCRRADPMHDTDGDRYCVRNYTDEGLGADERKSAYGTTLHDALLRAIEGDYQSPWDRESE